MFAKWRGYKVSGKYEEISSQSVPSADYRLVEESLTDLWKTAAEGHEGTQALTRVSVLNLVVFAREESIRQKVDSLVEEITGHPPLRAIFIQADPGGGVPTHRAPRLGQLRPRPPAPRRRRSVQG